MEFTSFSVEELHGLRRMRDVPNTTKPAKKLVFKQGEARHLSSPNTANRNKTKIRPKAPNPAEPYSRSPKVGNPIASILKSNV